MKFVLSNDSIVKAYRIDNVGKEIEIQFDVARRLVTEGRANVKDIELEKKDSIETEKKLPELQIKQKVPKLYTSRFQNPELKSGKYTVVGIVRGLPRFPLGYERAGNIFDIAHPKELFNIYDREQFTPPYMEHLDRIGFERISTQIKKYLSFGKDIVLCCYEDVRDPNEWCHRLVFAEWWLRNTWKK